MMYYQWVLGLLDDVLPVGDRVPIDDVLPVGAGGRTTSGCWGS